MIATDYFIASIIIFSALIGLIRGLISEIFSLVIWITAIFLSSKYYHFFSNFFTFFEEKYIRNIISMFFIFLLVLIVGTITNNYLNNFTNKIGLSLLNKFLGMCFGVLRGILIISILIFILKKFTNYTNSMHWINSKLIPYFDYIIIWIIKIIEKIINMYKNI
ncbi:cvpA [Wigglesworthia glossinidia endosymbiont of Glossina brevipalpis]|uniref:CvpA protein n=1 Tax=Wigglesworthia glossinidia brevipalpis TaxID=36870 RepID=Q8D2P2_WIGBR|nr:cvpA [Wigglesworthia glossinidia endosymbiont of Glossina brevipalpis]